MAVLVVGVAHGPVAAVHAVRVVAVNLLHVIKLLLAIAGYSNNKYLIKINHMISLFTDGACLPLRDPSEAVVELEAVLRQAPI